MYLTVKYFSPSQVTPNCNVKRGETSLTPGVHPVTCTGTDLAGNTGASDCTFTLTVIDTQAPSIVCPSKITRTLSTAGSALTIAVPLTTATDAVDPNPTVSCPNLPVNNSFPVGTTTVSCVATDASNNQNFCSYDVEVKDGAPPVFAGCAFADNVQSASPGKAQRDTLSPKWVTPTATDNVDGLRVVTCNASPDDSYPVGTTTVTCIAGDNSGNADQCTFDVVIEDREPPVVVCPDNGEEIAASPSFGYLFDVSSSDNVGVTNSSVLWVNNNQILQTTFASLDQFGRSLFIYTAQDAAGNVGACQWNFLLRDQAAIQDEDPPVISGCPTALSTGTDADKATGLVTWNIQVSDASGVAQSSYSPSSAGPGTQFPLGTTNVVFTAEDANGNLATCNFTVTVVDDDPPQITCPSSQSFVLATGESERVVSFQAPLASDNVGLAGPPQCDSSSGIAFPVGQKRITCTVNDTAGQSRFCNFDVTVDDREDPTIECPSNEQFQLAEGASTAFVDWGNATATDNDDVVSVRTDKAFGQFPQGAHVITFTATDPSGNKGVCTIIVTVSSADAAASSGSDTSASTMYGAAGAGFIIVIIIIVLIVLVRRSKNHAYPSGIYR